MNRVCGCVGVWVCAVSLLMCGCEWNWGEQSQGDTISENSAPIITTRESDGQIVLDYIDPTTMEVTNTVAAGVTAAEYYGTN